MLPTYLILTDVFRCIRSWHHLTNAATEWMVSPPKYCQVHVLLPFKYFSFVTTYCCTKLKFGIASCLQKAQWCSFNLPCPSELPPFPLDSGIWLNGVMSEENLRGYQMKMYSVPSLMCTKNWGILGQVDDCGTTKPVHFSLLSACFVQISKRWKLVDRWPNTLIVGWKVICDLTWQSYFFLWFYFQEII